MSDGDPNQPVNGDPEILPKGTIVRPSGERMPFGPSGELLPNGPQLPVDFLRAPDVANFDWQRLRGNEWTDAAFRTEILNFITTFFAVHSWAKGWAIVEKNQQSWGTALRFPVLVFKITDMNLDTHEVSQEFPEDERSGSALTARLLQVTMSLEALHP